MQSDGSDTQHFIISVLRINYQSNMVLLNERGQNTHGQGERVKIPLLPNTVGKKSVNDVEPKHLLVFHTFYIKLIPGKADPTVFKKNFHFESAFRSLFKQSRPVKGIL